MSLFTGLISTTFKQHHIDMITEVIRGSSVTCQLIFGITLYADCPNCEYDPIGNKSSNRYESGGPSPFTVGSCPVCMGVGKIPNEETEEISLAPIYDYKEWIPEISSNVRSPYGFVQTLSLLETYPSLQRAKEVIIDTCITSTARQRFERYQEPQVGGLGSSAFVMVLWKRIESG